MEFHGALVETAAVVLNYAEGPPNGPAYVLLHAGAARWQYGQALLEALVDSWHVYAPDFRGHGKSGRVPGAYRLQDYVDDTAAFLASVVREPAIVYGHSLGGEVAVMLAAQHSDLVRALIVGDAPLSKQRHATERQLAQAFRFAEQIAGAHVWLAQLDHVDAACDGGHEDVFERAVAIACTVGHQQQQGSRRQAVLRRHQKATVYVVCRPSVGTLLDLHSEPRRPNAQARLSVTHI